MSSFKNNTGSVQNVAFCTHFPQHKKLQQCPSLNSVSIPSQAIFTFDESAVNSSTITNLCQQVGLSPL